MLPTSLLVELYGREINKEEYEKMLEITEKSTFNYNPFVPLPLVLSMDSPNERMISDGSSKPMTPRSFSSMSDENPEKRTFNYNPFVPLPLVLYMDSPKERTISAGSSKPISPRSSSSMSLVSDENTSVSYWQDLEMHSSSVDDRVSPVGITKFSRNYPVFKYKNVPPKFCSFCYKSFARFCDFTSHNLRDSARNISCPVLFDVVCRICGATGANVHTPKYCPYRLCNH